MNVRKFIQVLLANCLVIICFNLLMLLPDLKVYLLAPERRILVGLCLFSLQIIMTKQLLKNHPGWLALPFKNGKVGKGIVAFLVSLLLTFFLVNIFDKDSTAGFDKNNWISFLTMFIFNSLPGALMEEWLFRYLPVRFVQSSSANLPANMIFLSALLLFTLIHIPAYLFQNHGNLALLGNIFVSGIFLFLIYVTTKNLFFTALFHAFCNHPQFFTNSALNWQYFYASIFLVTIFWPIRDYLIARRQEYDQTP